MYRWISVPRIVLRVLSLNSTILPFLGDCEVDDTCDYAVGVFRPDGTHRHHLPSENTKPSRPESVRTIMCVSP